MNNYTTTFRKGSSITIHINDNKSVRYVFTEDMTFNSFDEVADFVKANSYTCGSCQHDGRNGYCNYRGTDVTKEDIRARAEGRICSKFKMI